MNDEILNNLIRLIEELLQKRTSKIKPLQMDDPDLKPPLTNKDLAVFFNVSTRTLHSWRKDHGLKATYFSKRIYYREQDVIEYLRMNSK